MARGECEDPLRSRPRVSASSASPCRTVCHRVRNEGHRARGPPMGLGLRGPMHEGGRREFRIHSITHSPSYAAAVPTPPREVRNRREWEEIGFPLGLALSDRLSSGSERGAPCPRSSNGARPAGADARGREEGVSHSFEYSFPVLCCGSADASARSKEQEGIGGDGEWILRSLSFSFPLLSPFPFPLAGEGC